MSDAETIIERIDGDELLRILPHRPPILLLDAVTAVRPGVAATGHRRLEPGDPVLEGHFPQRPILPGVLLLEGAAQAALVMLRAGSREGVPGIGYLAQIGQASFYATVEPPCDIEFHLTFTRRLRNFTFVGAEVTRDGERCAKAKLTLAFDGG